MRKVIILLLLSIFVLAACGDDEPAALPEDLVTEAPPSNDPASDEEASPETEEIDASEFVSIDGGVQIPVTESCVDNSGRYIGQLPGNGYFILRPGDTPEESLVDFQPSANADPLSSQSGDDTVITDNSTSYVTGTSTVYTEDGANSLNLEFGIIIEDIDPNC